MKRIDRSIRQLYAKENDRFTYYCAEGEYSVAAGENGVTEEWIQLLKTLHRIERNDVRRDEMNVSWEAIDELVGDQSLCLTQEMCPLEDGYIEQEERMLVHSALKILSDCERKLLIDVRLRGRTITSIARKEGVHESTVRERLHRIEKKLRKWIESTPE